MHPLPGLILERRGLALIRSFYLEPLLASISGSPDSGEAPKGSRRRRKLQPGLALSHQRLRDGRVHTTFLPTATLTGRIGSVWETIG